MTDNNQPPARSPWPTNAGTRRVLYERAAQSGQEKRDEEAAYAVGLLARRAVLGALLLALAALAAWALTGGRP